jgi:hypothetical protein
MSHLSPVRTAMSVGLTEAQTAVDGPLPSGACACLQGRVVLYRCAQHRKALSVQ